MGKKTKYEIIFSEMDRLKREKKIDEGIPSFEYEILNIEEIYDIKDINHSLPAKDSVVFTTSSSSNNF